MKNLTGLTVVVLFVFILLGCGGGDEGPNEPLTADSYSITISVVGLESGNLTLVYAGTEIEVTQSGTISLLSENNLALLEIVSDSQSDNRICSVSQPFFDQGERSFTVACYGSSAQPLKQVFVEIYDNSATRVINSVDSTKPNNTIAHYDELNDYLLFGLNDDEEIISIGFRLDDKFEVSAFTTAVGAVYLLSSVEEQLIEDIAAQLVPSDLFTELVEHFHNLYQEDQNPFDDTKTYEILGEVLTEQFFSMNAVENSNNRLLTQAQIHTDRVGLLDMQLAPRKDSGGPLDSIFTLELTGDVINEVRGVWATHNIPIQLSYSVKDYEEKVVAGAESVIINEIGVGVADFVFDGFKSEPIPIAGNNDAFTINTFHSTDNRHYNLQLIASNIVGTLLPLLLPTSKDCAESISLYATQLLISQSISWRSEIDVYDFFQTIPWADMFTDIMEGLAINPSGIASSCFPGRNVAKLLGFSSKLIAKFVAAPVNFTVSTLNATGVAWQISAFATLHNLNSSVGVCMASPGLVEGFNSQLMDCATELRFLDENEDSLTVYMIPDSKMVIPSVDSRNKDSLPTLAPTGMIVTSSDPQSVLVPELYSFNDEIFATSTAQPPMDATVSVKHLPTDVTGSFKVSIQNPVFAALDTMEVEDVELPIDGAVELSLVALSEQGELKQIDAFPEGSLTWLTTSKISLSDTNKHLTIEVTPTEDASPGDKIDLAVLGPNDVFWDSIRLEISEATCTAYEHYPFEYPNGIWIGRRTVDGSWPGRDISVAIETPNGYRQSVHGFNGGGWDQINFNSGWVFSTLPAPGKVVNFNVHLVEETFVPNSLYVLRDQFASFSGTVSNSDCGLIEGEFTYGDEHGSFYLNLTSRSY